MKLIFNPFSGKQSSEKLLQVETKLQEFKSVCESYVIKKDVPFSDVISDALKRGIDEFIVCGGDGTVSSVVRELDGSESKLGIIPIGTQNNIAYSLKIPFETDPAINLLKDGQFTAFDIGRISCGQKKSSFIEVCSIGLISSVFSSADDIQHGNLLRISDFLSELAKTKPAQFHMLVDNKYQINGEAYCILISNMPYIFRHYEVGPDNAYCDGFLNVTIFADMTKLDLAGCAIKMNSLEDQRIKRFVSKKIELDTFPDMSVMADGVEIGCGHVKIETETSSVKVIKGNNIENIQK